MWEVYTPDMDQGPNLQIGPELHQKLSKFMTADDCSLAWVSLTFIILPLNPMLLLTAGVIFGFKCSFLYLHGTVFSLLSGKI
jgi:hypothetical protein